MLKLTNINHLNKSFKSLFDKLIWDHAREAYIDVYTAYSSICSCTCKRYCSENFLFVKTYFSGTILKLHTL